MSSGSPTARRALTALAAAAALVVPAQASAATAGLSGATLTIAGTSANDNLTVTSSGGVLTIADPALDVAQGSGCGQTSHTPKRVTCPAGGVTALGATLGDANDRLDSSAVALAATMYGGNGNDTLLSGSGVDDLNGDADTDTLDGGVGNDSLDGGAGGDGLVYTSHSLPVTISLGANNQTTATTGNGQSGENDSLIRFEYVLGGAGNDTITGDTGGNFLAGGPGNDTVNGGGGSDYVGYWERATNVTVSLTSRTGGATAGGEADTIGTDIENAMGGAGDDVVEGNNSVNTLWGGWSEGSAGVDGDDVLRGRGGADVLWGDQGTDTADYSDKTGAVTATLDGSANDGTSGEGDEIYTDVESIAGGSGNDTLTGNGSANVLTGGGGADTLNGSGGADTLNGLAGDDILRGSTGNDTLDGGGNADTLDAGTGDDAIAARDGAIDAIDCGDGADAGQVDANDALSADCETTVERPAAPPAGPPPEQPPAEQPPATQPPVSDPPVVDPPGGDDPALPGTVGPVAITTPATMELSPQGWVTIGIACTAESGTCRGTIELIESNGTIKARTVTAARRRPTKRKPNVLGRRNFAVRAGRKKNVRVRLERRGRQRVIRRRGRKTRAKLVITVKAPDGTTTTTTKSVTIKAPKERRTSGRGKGSRRKGAAR